MALKTVVIFGAFDNIHDGHREFIRQAEKQGERLVAIVARDEIVKNLKGKFPKYDEVKRINKLLEIKDIDLVLLGDPEIETYNIIKEIKPDIIYFGYDQKDLKENLYKMIKIGNLPKIEIRCGKPHKAKIFHSSILNK